MNTVLRLRTPLLLLPLRHLPIRSRPGAAERFSFALLLGSVLLGTVGIVAALLQSAG